MFSSDIKNHKIEGIVWKRSFFCSIVLGYQFDILDDSKSIEFNISFGLFISTNCSIEKQRDGKTSVLAIKRRMNFKGIDENFITRCFGRIFSRFFIVAIISNMTVIWIESILPWGIVTANFVWTTPDENGRSPYPFRSLDETDWINSLLKECFCASLRGCHKKVVSVSIDLCRF